MEGRGGTDLVKFDLVLHRTRQEQVQRLDKHETGRCHFQIRAFQDSIYHIDYIFCEKEQNELI